MATAQWRGLAQTSALWGLRSREAIASWLVARSRVAPTTVFDVRDFSRMNQSRTALPTYKLNKVDDPLKEFV
jgi:hypothetical protein